VRVVDGGVPSITLLSELPADLRTAPAEPSGAATLADAAVVPEASREQPDGSTDPADAADNAAAAVTAGVDPAVQTTAAVPSISTAAGAALCSSVGPFRDLSQAATAAANLRAAGYQPTQRVAEGDIWIGYWVYIEAIPTEREANEILATMRAEGITDSYVIANSDSGNLVSLGVFSEISGVSRRREQVRALGHEPTVVDRTRRATVYWVDVLLGAGQTLDFDTLQTPGRIIRQKSL
jgi:cell division septation protein DedD